MSTYLETPVLIAGAGPVGLALALDLNHYGVGSLLAEQEAGTALVVQAKAGTHNERTMEFCRRWGLIDEIAASYPEDEARDTVYCTALDGHYIGRSQVASARERGTPAVGPEMMRRCAQNQFDPILARAVQASSHAQLRYGLRFESFEQDDDGVTSQLRDVLSGDTLQVRSQFLVGCEGVVSGIRKALDIPFELIKQMGFSLSAMLRIDHLENYHPFGSLERFMFIGSEGTWANMTSVDGRGLWRFTVVGAESALDASTYDIRPIIRRAFGSLNIPYVVERMVPWRRAQTLARTYGQGRVLLAGDAVHTTSPTGGHGLNTGIGDATDLSWMLAARVQGWGGAHLLEAYTQERRPVALRNLGSATQNYNAWVGGGMDHVAEDGARGEAARRNIGDSLVVSLHQEWSSQGIALGYRYDQSPLVVPDGTPDTPDHPSFYVPTARPGHRAPHAWLEDGRSILDLFGPEFVLLCFEADTAASAPMLQAAKAVGLPLRVEHIAQPEVLAVYQRRWVLVRPDGHVAWRSDALPQDDGRALIDTVRGACMSAAPLNESAVAVAAF
jgi:2-polyprenyl-6-methoxyphenol hydroxylase-like FAD-dependent oxidoreductase